MIEIEEVTKTYGAATVVDRVSMTVETGRIATIVGTSGSGKTTLMRMINRLVEPSAGVIRIDGRDNRSLPPHELRRSIGYAIQGYGLFPHRTVGQNIATVPVLLGWERKRVAARVDELLELFQLEPAQFRDRMPHELSGGQQQRVGVARALAAEPGVLLMDEPFGALDPIIRAKAQDDLLAIQRQVRTTIVLVTHDMDEAARLGDMIAVMDAGRLLQYAPPAHIVARPATPFVAELVGDGDRSLRLLALASVVDALEAGPAEGEALPDHLSAREALARCLWTGREAAPVVACNGKVVGRVTLSGLARLAVPPR